MFKGPSAGCRVGFFWFVLGCVLGFAGFFLGIFRLLNLE